jgi:hypothetical protein
MLEPSMFKAKWIESENLSFGNPIGSVLPTEGGMKASISLTVGGLGYSLMFLSPSSAIAATKADVEGKKICWSQDNSTIFHSGGTATSSIAGEGKWAIGKAGVITLKFPSGPYSGVIAIKAGGMVEYSGSWIGAPTLTAIGSFCN